MAADAVTGTERKVDRTNFLSVPVQHGRFSYLFSKYFLLIKYVDIDINTKYPELFSEKVRNTG